VGVLGELGQVVAPLRERAEDAAARDEEPAERRLVAVELAEQALARLEAGREVLVGAARLALVPAVDDGLPLDHVLERLAGVVVEGVEELVEIYGGGR